MGKPNRTSTEIESAVELLSRTQSPVPPAETGLGVHANAVRTDQERWAERRLLWKVDLIVLPLIAILYFLAALDRSDVSNAAVAGMDDDLHMTPGQLSNCIAFFYIGFMLFELPGSILVRVLTPPLQLGGALLGWGAMTMIMSRAENWGTIAGIRVLVGAFEAFVEGAPLYLTFWYKQNELATRGAVFLSMQSLAGSMNGLIAYSIETTLDGHWGWPSWRWIFFVEGIVSVGMGILMMIILPSTPEAVRWGFTASEQKIALRRTQEAFNVPHAKLSPRQVWAALKDRKIWFYMLLNGCSSIGMSAWSQFMPVIIENLGYADVQVQIMTVPVYGVAGVTTLMVGYTSDKLRRRGVLLTGCFAVAAAGWVILLVSKIQKLSYAGVFLIGMGTMPSIILEMAWLNNNIIGYTKKGSALAYMNIFGHICSLVSTFAFRDGPDYFIGKGLSIGATVVGAGLAPCLILYLRRQNAKKLAKKDSLEAAEKRLKGAEELCDDHPDYMYSM